MSKRKNGFNPFSEVHNRYLIRRFSVGTASMLIGATLFFGMQLDLLSAHAQEEISIEMQGSLAEPETLQEILDQVVEVESVAPVAEEAIEVEETLEVSVEETVTQEVEEVAEEVSSEETNTSEEKEEVAEEKVVEEVQVEEVAPAAPVQEEKVQAPVQQAAQTSVQEETTATKETVEEDPRFVPLNEQLDAGIDPLVVAEAFLSEVYSPEDVTGILNFVAPAELQGLRGRDFIERIVLAGQEYASNSLPFGHAFAAMPKEITVADGLQIINPQIVITGEGRNENSIRVTRGGHSEIHFDFAIPNNLNVQLGDYFVIDGSRDKMKLTPDSSRLMSGNDVVADIVRISPYQLRVVFTDFVNTHTDVSGSIHYGARPDYYDPMYAHGTRKIDVTTGDGSYRDNERFTLGVDVAGQRVEKQGVAIDYGMRRNREIYLGGYTREVIDGELKDTVNIILNPGGTKYNAWGGIMRYPSGQYVVTLYDPNGTPINLNEVSYKVYRTGDADNITENFYPDVNDSTKFEDITHLSTVKDISENGKFRLSLNSLQTQGESIVIKVAIPEETMPKTIEGVIRGPLSFGTQYHTISLTSVQYDSSADGQRVVEENGFFIERHEYITLDQSDRIVSSETDVSDMQSGKNYEYFRTEQQLKDGFKLQNVTPTTIANADGSPAAKPFIPGELQQVTYTYARTVETPPETDSSQDHLTFEMIEETKGYETQYVLNPQLNPGQIQVKQRGQIGREKFLYEHVDPVVTSNFNPDNFVEFRGQYWREVSREIIQPVQNEIVEYNFVSIVSSEKNPDGGVTIHYNDGTKIIIPGPDKPAEPNDPLLPNEPMIKVEENVQDNAGNIGTKVTVEIFNPNTKEFESQREFFIKHGQDGQDGIDGESPTVDVQNNGDGSHTITITNPDGTETKTTVYDGAKGDKGDPGQDGAQGTDGKSAYDIWIEAGNEGTEQDFLDSLKGEKGDKGDPSADGAQGADGKDGATPNVTIEPGWDDQNNPGRFIIFTHPDTGEELGKTFIKDAVDGKDGDSIRVETTPGTKGDDTGVWIYVYQTTLDEKDNPTEELVSEEFIRDGKDGQSPKAEVKDNGDGTHTLIVTNPNGTTTETIIQNGTDGNDGLTPTVETQKNQDGSTTIIIKDGAGEIIDEIIIRDGEKGAKGDKGEDGKSATAEVINNGDGTHTLIVTNPDGTKTEILILDGAQGEDGKDGLTPTVETVENADGLTTIIIKDGNGDTINEITVRDGKDGKDGISSHITQERTNQDGKDGTLVVVWKTDANGAVIEGSRTETFIADGVDGKTPSIETEPVVDETGQQIGVKIIVKDGNGDVVKEETVLNGQDGKDGKDEISSHITQERTQRDGKDGTLVVVWKTDANGDVIEGSRTETFIADGDKGEDGKTPVIDLKRFEDEAGNTGTTIIVRDPDTNEEISREVVYDGKDGLNGQDPKDGVDGKTPVVELERFEDEAGNTGTIIIVKDPDTNEEISREVVCDGKDGLNGQDGKDGVDGESPTVDTTTNEDGSTTITITNPDGSTHTLTVANGKDGEDGKSATAEIIDNGDGTHKLMIINPNGTTTETTILDGAKGEDGKDGLTPTVETQRNDDGSTTIIIKDGNGEIIDEITIKDGKDGLDGIDGIDGEDGKSPTVDTTTNEDGSTTITITNLDGTTHTFTVENGKDGEDGLTPSVETQRNDDGSTTIIIKDGNGQIIDEITVRDGEDGKSPIADVVQNADGSHTVTITKPDGSKYTFIVENGEDGKSPTVDTTTNADGSTIITITNPDGTTHIFTVENGRDGEDGKSPTVDTVTNEDGSTTITITNPDGSTQTFTVKDGKDGLDGQDGLDGIDGKDGVDGVDGKSPIINITQNPDGSHTVTVINPDGPTNAFIVENGEDGKSPTADVVQNADGSHTVTINNSDGTHYTFVVENGKDGQDGKDGVDGKSPIVNVEDNGDGTHTITIINPDGSKTTTVVKDGKDGEAPTISTTENADGSQTVTVENPDGSTHSFIVKKGKDGLDGKDGVDGQDGIGGIDGKSPTINITQNPDGSHTITVVNPDGTTNEFVVENGEDDKSPTVSTTENADGSHTITIINPDGSTHSFIVKNGKDGADGQDGKDGIDGKVPTVNITDNGDGSHTVTIINPDGTKSETTIYNGKTPTVETRPGEGGTHIIFRDSETGEILTETFIRDGKDGVDGKTPTIETIPEKDAQGNLLDYWIITKDGDGREVSRVFVQGGKDGKDGLSPTVKVEEGRNHKDESGQWFIVFDGNGNEISRDFVRDGIDGKDGESYVIETQPGRNEFGQTGIWVITRNEKGEEISLHFVRDGIDGKDGKDGEDGRGIVKIINKNNQLIVVYNDFTTEIIEIPCPETPEKPEEPEVPETPEQPGKPEEPETPEVPETPEQPGKPEEPETPEVPETPEQPGEPEEPETPEVPETPEQPGESEEPETPEVPETPEQPAQPNEPTEDEAGHPSSDKATVLPNTGDQSLMTFSFLTLLSGLGVTLSRRKEQ